MSIHRVLLCVGVAGLALFTLGCVTQSKPTAQAPTETRKPAAEALPVYEHWDAPSPASKNGSDRLLSWAPSRLDVGVRRDGRTMCKRHLRMRSRHFPHCPSTRSANRTIYVFRSRASIPKRSHSRRVTISGSPAPMPAVGARRSKLSRTTRLDCFTPHKHCGNWVNSRQNAAWCPSVTLPTGPTFPIAGSCSTSRGTRSRKWRPCTT